MSATKEHLRNLAAAVAALALILHSMIGSLAEGAMASAALTGDFSGFICSSHSDGSAPTVPARSGRVHLPDCCVSGCSLAHGAGPAPSDTVHVAVGFGERLNFPLPAYAEPMQRFDRPRLNPRAPPALA